MAVKDHYLTFAAFLINDAANESTTIAVDFSAGDNLDGKAVIRKLCICGSQVTFDQDEMVWRCLYSGNNLEISPWNLEPLAAPSATGNCLDPYITDLGHPERDSVIGIDQEGRLHVLVKVPKRHLWVISDPLPVFTVLTIEPIHTDLIANWNLYIGYDSKGDISAEIPLNILDPFHEKVLEMLASDSVVDLHFLDAESFLAVGHKYIRPESGISYTIKKLRHLVSTLPTEPHAREAALNDWAVARQVSMMAFSDKMGLCTGLTYLASSGRSFSISKYEDHISQCESCQRIMRKREI